MTLDERPQNNHDEDLAQEQAYVDDLFARLDAEIAAARTRLEAVMLRVDPSNPDPEALVERETEYHGLNAKLDRLQLAQMGLVFGQITVATTPHQSGLGQQVGEGLERRYIGRMGIDDRADNYRTLLLDWRAPAARPFYLATTAQPEGVHRRRHIRTTGRKVVGIDDEYLAADAPVNEESGNVVSETALYRALNAARSAHMGTIVETIQREQDAIIRDSTRGIMVVEGGPGTGKTAVALHRVAYLLYTWREQLEKTGVLIIGPNATFLRYISRVLPELGETGVVLSTIGDLYPGVNAVAKESLAAREIKGSEEMVYILKEAVKRYQRLDEFQVLVDRTELVVTQSMVKTARTRARRSRLPHNEARAVFRDALLDQLARAYGEILFEDPLGTTVVPEAEVAQLHDELAELPQIHDVIDALWPELTPEDTLAELLGDEAVIAAVAHEYDEDTQAALWRADGRAWTASDAALLDELAEIIGVVDPEQQQAEAEAKWKQHVAEAQEALDILTGSATQDLDDGFDAEILQAHDVVDAETLAQRQQVRDSATTAQRAARDARWAFGHVIVDEAQELSPMEWRMVMRRCPSRWMTLLGDPAQTGAPAGVDSWADALAPFVAQRFRRHQLTVNYRTPTQIMEFAQQLLEVVAPDQTPSTSLRSDTQQRVFFFPAAAEHKLRGSSKDTADATDAETSPTSKHAGTSLDVADIEDELVAHLRQLRAQDEQRRIAFIVADPAAAATLVELAALIDAEVFTVDEAKGLEFDHVVVVDASAIVAASIQGYQDLYVALTRATQTLTLIGPLPAPLQHPDEAASTRS